VDESPLPEYPAPERGALIWNIWE